MSDPVSKTTGLMPWTALAMVKALRGSLENGCVITVGDLDILIALIEQQEDVIDEMADAIGRSAPT